jgi:hypothetical protein
MADHKRTPAGTAIHTRLRHVLSSGDRSGVVAEFVPWRGAVDGLAGDHRRGTPAPAGR